MYTVAGIASQTGHLDGKSAPTFKGAWKPMTAWRAQVELVHSALWMVSLEHLDFFWSVRNDHCRFCVCGEDIAKQISIWMEDERDEDGDSDPFAAREPN